MHNFSTVIHTKKCDKIGICEKTGEILHMKSQSYPQVIPKVWITLCKPISLHNCLCEIERMKKDENKGKMKTGNEKKSRKRMKNQ